MIPERIMGTAKMNDTNITTGAYVGSKMYTEYLAPFKAVIQNDFEIGHILNHKELLTNAIQNMDVRSRFFAFHRNHRLLSCGDISCMLLCSKLGIELLKMP